MRIGSPFPFSSNALAILTMAYALVIPAHAQESLDVSAHFSPPPQHDRRDVRAGMDRPPAVIWLTALGDKSSLPTPGTGPKFTLLQKNKQFYPHVLVVPVGSVVQFPNADPFFHNVFSLFDGKRFDLGLYEAGSTRSVTFGKEGISYIFCNIHPEMSAVVIALSTPYFAIEERKGAFHIHNVPAGDYMLQVWVQGADPDDLKLLSRKVHLSADHADLGDISLSRPPHPSSPHTNKYGEAYDTRETPIY